MKTSILPRFVSIAPTALLALIPAALLAHAAPPARAQFACTAVYRSLDDKNNTVERTADIPVRATLAGEQVKHVLANLEGRRFLVTEDHGELFAQIIAPSDSAKGVTARGTADSAGRFSLAEVAGYTVFRIECSR